MTSDATLVAEVIGFRFGILDGRPSAGMCAMVCLPLAGYLSAILGIEADVVEGEINIDGVAWINHVWLKLSDGRVLDPTADQFNEVLGASHPAVYLGKPDPVIHRQRYRLVEVPLPARLLA